LRLPAAAGRSHACCSGERVEPQAHGVGLPDVAAFDIKAFANFMRSTKAPSRRPITADVQAGDALFNKIDCAVCHVPSIVTAQPGTVIDNGAFTVPALKRLQEAHQLSSLQVARLRRTGMEKHHPCDRAGTREPRVCVVRAVPSAENPRQTAIVSVAVRPPLTLPLIVASSRAEPSLKTLSVASVMRERLVTLLS